MYIVISRQPNNNHFKLYVIPVIDNYWILLKIKLLPPPWAKGNFSWFIHIYLGITTNAIHKYLNAIHGRLCLSSIHLMSTSALPQKRRLVIFYTCESLYPCTIPHRMAPRFYWRSWQFSLSWLLTSTVRPLSIWQEPYWNILPTFLQDISRWNQCPKYHNLDFCNQKYIILEDYIFQVTNYLFIVLQKIGKWWDIFIHQF